MKLSNQNICNLRGCQMPLGGGGGANHFWGGGAPRTTPENLCLNVGGLLKEDGLI